MLIMILNEAEQRLAKYLATMRNRNAVKLGTYRKPESGQPDSIVDLDGIGGEIAFCKMANLYFEGTAITSLPFPEGDATAFDGKTKIDVKTTRQSDPQFVYIQIDKANKSTEIYAFIRGTFPEYHFLGFLWRSEIFRPENIVSVNGRPPCYRVSVRALSAFNPKIIMKKEFLKS